MWWYLVLIHSFSFAFLVYTHFRWYFSNYTHHSGQRYFCSTSSRTEMSFTTCCCIASKSEDNSRIYLHFCYEYHFRSSRLNSENFDNDARQMLIRRSNMLAIVLSYATIIKMKNNLFPAIRMSSPPHL
jgi:hypothetical protein